MDLRLWRPIKMIFWIELRWQATIINYYVTITELSILLEKSHLKLSKRDLFILLSTEANAGTFWSAGLTIDKNYRISYICRDNQGMAILLNGKAAVVWFLFWFISKYSFEKYWLLSLWFNLTIERRTFWTNFNDESGHFDRCEINWVVFDNRVLWPINSKNINSQLVKYAISFTELCLCQVFCYYLHFWIFQMKVIIIIIIIIHSWWRAICPSIPIGM